MPFVSEEIDCLRQVADEKPFKEDWHEVGEEVSRFIGHVPDFQTADKLPSFAEKQDYVFS